MREKINVGIYSLEDVYEPREDSYLLLRYVEKFVEGGVLDVGTGCGIQAIGASLNPCVEFVIAVDLNPKAIEKARERAINAGAVERISFVIGNLMDWLRGRLDWIIFNPPYLPGEELSEISWSGGERGGEVIERFLMEAHKHLKPGGAILLIYSTLTGLGEGSFTGYEVEVLEELPLFFERLFCVLLRPSRTQDEDASDILG